MDLLQNHCEDTLVTAEKFFSNKEGRTWTKICCCFLAKQIHPIRNTGTLGGVYANDSLRKGDGNTFRQSNAGSEENQNTILRKRGHEGLLEGEKGILLSCPRAKMAWPSVADFSVCLQKSCFSAQDDSLSPAKCWSGESRGGKKTGKIALLSSSSVSPFFPAHSLSTFSPDVPVWSICLRCLVLGGSAISSHVAQMVSIHAGVNSSGFL